MKSPYQLYKETGGGDAYRVSMLEHGYIIPSSPPLQLKTVHLLPKPPGKRLQPCGNLHMADWSEWHDYEDQYGPYRARWCRICARVDASSGIGEPAS